MKKGSSTPKPGGKPRKKVDPDILEFKLMIEDSFSERLKGKNWKMHNAIPFDENDEVVTELEASEYDAVGTREITLQPPPKRSKK